MKVKIKKRHPYAIIPQYATKGAACFDLHSIEYGTVWPDDSEVFRTGLSFEIPEKHVMLIFSRSGHGFNHAVRLSNCTGVIDPDYRGEIKVKLHNDSLDEFFVDEKSRIAQAIIIPAHQVQFDEVEELSETERGEGGFGSTGER